MKTSFSSLIGNCVLFFLLVSLISYGCTKSNANYSDAQNTNKIIRTPELPPSSDTAFISDSLRKIDSIFKADSLRKLDSLLRLKADSVRKTDSLLLTDSLRKVDSIFKTDLLRRADSTAKADSLRRIDSIAQADALHRLDSIAKVDSLRRADSIAKAKADSIAKLPPPTPPVTQPPLPPPPVANGRIINVGYGFGDLVVDGNNLVINGNKSSFQNNDLVIIKGGSYNSISIKNISVANSNARVKIANDGLITLNGDFRALYVSNLNNVTITGAGSSGNDRGFAFINNKYRAVVMEGNINNFTLQNMLFKNVGDYVINYIDNKNKTYNGSSSSYASNLAFLNLDADNIGSHLIYMAGGMMSYGFTGLVRNVEVAGISCINSSGAGGVVMLENAEDYNIHDNYVTNINSQNNNHNAIFMLKGNGKFYNNTITNHQGNAVRAWLYSVDNTTQTVEIYNNIVYNSRKYSGFELQVTPDMKASYLFKPANAKVYNNTVGKMNTEKNSFPGCLLDLYNTYGTLEFYNNLAFENSDPRLIQNMSDTKITVNTNNIYKASEWDAISNTTSFTSKISGVGAVK